LTTELLGFEHLNYNVVYAQMGRGKAERIVAQAMANLADTLSRLSMDMCIYLNQHFDFVSFPAELTTGSSIMPHKKNPDVFELIRSHCNRIKALPNEISMMTTNLPSGYHRDLQLLKEHLFPAFQTLQQCIQMAALMLSNIQIKKDILKDDKFKYLFTVDAVNELVKQGTPFRDAYKIIGKQVEEGSFKMPDAPTSTTHEGSIGNLCNREIAVMMQQVLNGFGFEHAEQAVSRLLTPA
jgi:argininosuccinate lyase